MKKTGLLVLIFMCFTGALRAKEGMWLPMLLESLNQDDMFSMGLEISPEDIYSTNKSSLKDAVVIFGGGCTGEVISSNGLVLTNHHCGYGAIQSHSSVENDYLTEGFWAMSEGEELPNKGLSVTFIRSMEDVTKAVFEGITDELTLEQQQNLMQENIAALKKEKETNEFIKVVIKPFFKGNYYYMFITEEFADVRLVGAPPSSIGKFGFDTDNWMWPRHTGDFSMFRIYTSPDGSPAKYDEANVPMSKAYHLQISLDGYEKGDFTMVYGFPGTTEEYLPAVQVQYIMETLNPARIKMRDTSLEVMAKYMDADKKINIQYAAKQSRISNAWKKWIGQNNGLYRLDAVNKKLDFERKLEEVMHSDQDKYGSAMHIPVEYGHLYEQKQALSFSREMLIELYYYGPEVLRYAHGFTALANEELSEEQRTKAIEKLKASSKGHFKNYHQAIDAELLVEMMPLYLELMEGKKVPQSIADNFGAESKFNASEELEKSYFSSASEVEKLLAMSPKKMKKTIESDPFYLMGKGLIDTYSLEVRPELSAIDSKLQSFAKDYMQLIMVALPNEKVYYPNANFTLRLAYGQVEGYEPKDGVSYSYYTTVDGIIQKMDNSTKEFSVSPKLVELCKTKDFGNWADENGDMRVCFIASNHTTGGNSGSPALNSKGQLIGLNFDRTWESTMSDIMFDPDRCRNIMVDIRYVLFIVEKFAGAQHLIDELDFAKNETEKESAQMNEEEN